MSQNKTNFAIPLAFVGMMFFAIGFALGINSLLVPVLQGSLGISNAASYLIIAATFIPFLIFGYPAGLTIKAIGYKRTMSLSFFIFAVAFYLFILSADGKSSSFPAGFFYQRCCKRIPAGIGQSLHHHFRTD